MSDCVFLARQWNLKIIIIKNKKTKKSLTRIITDVRARPPVKSYGTPQISRIHTPEGVLCFSGPFPVDAPKNYARTLLTHTHGGTYTSDCTLRVRTAPHNIIEV